ncbi:MAG TPA: ATP-binding protein [Gemmatimonadaceae bacterium]|nr:ATP-binding protein [Gemmatimonadaceae bacterium]
MSKRGRVMANDHQIVGLEFTSALEMLDSLQVASDHIAYSVGLDEDTSHWVSVAVRESVINAITHGNRNDATKRVFVEFETTVAADVELSIRVRDEGEGFDPEAVANPLAPENLLKSSGWGIFLIRKLMDDVRLQRAPEGGMEIRMIKRATSSVKTPRGTSAELNRPTRSRHDRLAVRRQLRRFDR